MNYPFCTISTQSHLFKCFALADSISKFNGFLHILVVDTEKVDENNIPNNVHLYYLSDIRDTLSEQIISKYKSSIDKLRWSLKSIFLIFLLKDTNKVIYVDNDILFFNDFRFLFDLLKKNKILLTPHHYKRTPLKEQNWLEANFRVGLYNAGFVGVSTGAEDTLKWWAEACLYRCEKNYFRGLFDDQKYLDLFPVMEENTYIIRHEGCNVAAWNSDILKLTIKHGKFIVNHSFSLIFYHFNDYSLQKLDKNQALFTHYLTYLKPYKKDLRSLYKKESLSFLESLKLKIWNILNTINR